MHACMNTHTHTPWHTHTNQQTHMNTYVHIYTHTSNISEYTVTGTIHQLEMEIDPTGHVVTETSRKQGGGSRGGKSGADKKRDWRKNRTPEEIEKERQKDRDRKKPNRGGGASG